jgi:hypothetical protein
LAWTTPTIRATGDLITASIYNADIINNLLALAPIYEETTLVDINTVAALTSVFTAAPSIPASAMGTKGKLSVDIAGDWLNNTGVNRGLQLQILLGGTVLHDSSNFSIGATSANRAPRDHRPDDRLPDRGRRKARRRMAAPSRLPRPARRRPAVAPRRPPAERVPPGQADFQVEAERRVRRAHEERRRPR